MSVAASTTPDFIDRFESHLKRTLHDPHHDKRKPPVLMVASRHLAFAGAAKRMRPLLVDHFGASVELADRHRLAIATSAELIHTASLLHDDVIDEGAERRGKATANAQWDNSVAVLSGDLVLCIALEQLYELPRPVTRAAVDLVADMTRGAMLEVQARKSRDWDLDDWSTIADGKTGALLAWCGTAPAIACAKPELATRFADCGHHLGLAFQITDDLLDLIGGQTGKDPFADLKNANPSFPIALSRTQNDKALAAIDELWSSPTAADDALEQVANLIIDSGVPVQTLRQIEEHLDRALESLGEFADGPGGRHIADWAAQLRLMATSSVEAL